MWQVLWPQKVMESWCSLFMQASKLPSTVKKEKCLLSDNILDLHSDLQTPAQTFTYTSMFKCKTHFLNNSTKSAAGFQLHEVPHPASFNIHHHISLSSYSNRRIPIWILARHGVRGCQLRVSAYTGTNAHTESLWWRKCITVHIYIFTDRWSVLCARSTMCVKTASSLFSEALLRNYPASGLAAVKSMGWWWGWFTVVGRFETDLTQQPKDCLLPTAWRKKTEDDYFSPVSNEPNKVWEGSPQKPYELDPEAITWKQRIIFNNKPVNSRPPYHLTGKCAICLSAWKCAIIWAYEAYWGNYTTYCNKWVVKLPSSQSITGLKYCTAYCSRLKLKLQSRWHSDFVHLA